MKKKKILPLLMSTVGLTGSIICPILLTSCNEEAPKITITLESDEHCSIEENALTVEVGEKWGGVQPKDPQTEPGYHFYKWVNENNEVIKPDFEITQDFKAKAICEKNNFMVYFRATNGNIDNDEYSKQVSYGMTWAEVLPNVNPDEGHLFNPEKDWKDSEGNVINLNDLIRHGDSATAECEQQMVKITLESDQYCTIDKTSIDVPYGKNWGSVIKPIPEVTTVGYIFREWYDNTDTIISQNKIIKESFTAKAKCEQQNFIIYFSAINGTVDKEKTEKVGAGSTWRSVIDGKVHVTPDDGYNFKEQKWQDKDGNEINLDDKIMSSNSIAAVCTRNKVKVSFIPDSSNHCKIKEEEATIDVECGSTWGSIKKPEVESIDVGYCFLGWYYSNTGATIDPNTVIDDDFTAKAGVSHNRCELYFSAQNGKVSKTYELVISEGQKIKDHLPEVTPDDYYKFNNKWQDQNGNIVDIENDITDSLSLVAICERKNINVNLTVQGDHYLIEALKSEMFDIPSGTPWGQIWKDFQDYYLAIMTIEEGYHLDHWENTNKTETIELYDDTPVAESLDHMKPVCVRDDCELTFCVDSDCEVTLSETHKTCSLDLTWKEIVPKVTVVDESYEGWYDYYWVDENHNKIDLDSKPTGSGVITCVLRFIERQMEFRVDDGDLDRTHCKVNWTYVWVKPRVRFCEMIEDEQMMSKVHPLDGYEFSYWQTQNGPRIENERMEMHEVLYNSSEKNGVIEPIAEKPKSQINFKAKNGSVSFSTNKYDNDAKWGDIEKPEIEPIQWCEFKNKWVDQNNNEITNNTTVKNIIEATAICERIVLPATFQCEEPCYFENGSQHVQSITKDINIGLTWEEVDKPEIKDIPVGHEIRWYFADGEDAGKEVPSTYRIKGESLNVIAKPISTNNEIFAPDQIFRQEKSWVITNQTRLETVFGGFRFFPDKSKAHSGDWTANDISNISVMATNGNKTISNWGTQIINFAKTSDNFYTFDLVVSSENLDNMSVGDTLDVIVTFDIKYSESETSTVSVGTTEDDKLTIDYVEKPSFGTIGDYFEIGRVIHYYIGSDYFLTGVYNKATDLQSFELFDSHHSHYLLWYVSGTIIPDPSEAWYNDPIDEQFRIEWIISGQSRKKAWFTGIYYICAQQIKF